MGDEKIVMICSAADNRKDSEDQVSQTIESDNDNDQWLVKVDVLEDTTNDTVAELKLTMKELVIKRSKQSDSVKILTE